MIIIISGCDRTGKTTFCNQLKSKLNNYEYIHFSVPATEEQAYNEYLNFINTADSNKLYIIDRFYESEAVYAPIYRNYHIAYHQKFDDLLRKNHKILFIYIQADLNIIKQRINDIGDDFININDIEKICFNYNIYMQSIKLPYIIINNNTLTDLYSNINVCLNIINNYNFIDDYFGNLHAKNAIIFKNKIRNDVHNYICAIGPNKQLKIKEDLNSKDNDYIVYYESNSKLVNYTDYFYTNNDINANLLNINERLYVYE